MQYFIARYYDPEAGRFLSKDPVPNGNLYVYCEQNPVNKIDLDGKAGEPIIAAASLTMGIACGFYEAGMSIAKHETYDQVFLAAGKGIAGGFVGTYTSLYVGEKLLEKGVNPYLAAMAAGGAGGALGSLASQTVEYAATDKVPEASKVVDSAGIGIVLAGALAPLAKTGFKNPVGRPVESVLKELGGPNANFLLKKELTKSNIITLAKDTLRMWLEVGQKNDKKTTDK